MSKHFGAEVSVLYSINGVVHNSWLINWCWERKVSY